MSALHELVLTLKKQVLFICSIRNNIKKKILVQIHVERDICIFLNIKKA